MEDTEKSKRRVFSYGRCVATRPVLRSKEAPFVEAAAARRDARLPELPYLASCPPPPFFLSLSLSFTSLAN